MLIDAFKEMTSYLEGYCTIEEINDVRLYFSNKITKYKKHKKGSKKFPIWIEIQLFL